jgi:transposase-like protein
MVGARIDGQKELIAVQDGYRQSEESWAELLRDLKKRGMRSPVLAVGDGALGLWGALRDAFPQRPVLSAIGSTKPPPTSWRRYPQKRA